MDARRSSPSVRRSPGTVVGDPGRRAPAPRRRARSRDAGSARATETTSGSRPVISSSDRVHDDLVTTAVHLDPDAVELRVDRRRSGPPPAFVHRRLDRRRAGRAASAAPAARPRARTPPAPPRRRSARPWTRRPSSRPSSRRGVRRRGVRRPQPPAPPGRASRGRPAGPHRSRSRAARAAPRRSRARTARRSRRPGCACDPEPDSAAIRSNASCTSSTVSDGSAAGAGSDCIDRQPSPVRRWRSDPAR